MSREGTTTSTLEDYVEAFTRARGDSSGGLRPLGHFFAPIRRALRGEAPEFVVLKHDDTQFVLNVKHFVVYTRSFMAVVSNPSVPLDDHPGTLGASTIHVLPRTALTDLVLHTERAAREDLAADEEGYLGWTEHYELTYTGLSGGIRIFPATYEEAEFARFYATLLDDLAG